MEKIYPGYSGYKEVEALRVAEAYINNNQNLKEVIKYIENVSDSIGLSLKDYASLYATVIRIKPKVVLECGTGKSTSVIAQAMMDNQKNLSTDSLKLISMEQDKRWHEIAVSTLPERFKNFVEIHYSPVEIFDHAFFQGTAYSDIPKYPYEFVFIDGPKQYLDDKGNLCNMDFINILKKSNIPVSAFIDNRLNTVMVYSLLFGPSKVKYFKAWGHSIIENVTKNDILIDDKTKRKILWSYLVQQTYAKPDGI